MSDIKPSSINVLGQYRFLLKLKTNDRECPGEAHEDMVMYQFPEQLIATFNIVIAEKDSAFKPNDYIYSFYLSNSPY
ncbi:MAG: hypothetical protein OEX07_15955 [Gammaproteobacteria bacterium]|nr:hypothetical protein [Gammaproteobacteria bacterium]